MTWSSNPRPRRRLSGLVLSGAFFAAPMIGGCGPTEKKVEMTPEAKKALLSTKVGDPSKFVKPKGVGGPRR